MSESTEQIKQESWNECIVPNLETLSAYFNQPQWRDMTARYLKAMEARLTDKLISSEDRTREQERFLAGEIAMLREILALPTVIKRNIDAAKDLKEQAKARNPVSGY